MSTYIQKVERFTQTLEAQERFAPMIEAYRDGKMIAVVQCLQVSRDLALKTLPTLVGGMNLDTVVLAIDAYVTRTTNNPLTGKPWEQGDMSKVMGTGIKGAMAAVSDALNVTEVHRDGRASAVSLPYHRDDEGKVFWHPDVGRIEPGDGFEVGLVPDHLRHAFEVPVMDDDVIRQGMALTGMDSMQRARISADCAVAKMLMDALDGEIVVMMLGYDQLSEEVIRESFADSETLDIHV